MGGSKSRLEYYDATTLPSEKATIDIRDDIIQIEISELIEDPSLNIKASEDTDFVVRHKLFLQRCLQTGTYMLQVDNELPKSESFAASELDYFVANATDNFEHQVSVGVVCKCEKSEDGTCCNSILFERGEAREQQTEVTTTDSFYKFEIDGDILNVALNKLAEQSEEVTAGCQLAAKNG